MMNKVLKYIAFLVALALPFVAAGFFGGTSGSSDLSSTSFMFNASEFFPTAGNDGEEPAEGVENVNRILEMRTPVLIILVATFATVMIVIGGIVLISASGKEDLAQKGKGIIVTAILALIFGLGAYVIVAVVANFIDA